jgi:hypothetical protein
MMRVILTALFTCLVIGLKAQLAVSFMPEVQGRTIDGLWKARIANSGGTQNVNVVITVKESSAGAVVTIQTPQFDLLPGVNTIPANAAYHAAPVFGNSQLATVVRQSGFFPAGDYEYCFQVYEGISHDVLLSAEQCFTYNLDPFSSLQLIQPYDGDKICDKRPAFTWQPLVPAVSGVLYRMILVEVLEGQQRVEAIRTNLAVINQVNIPAPMLLYPSMVNDLVVGRKYAWQVAAYNNGLLLAESEIWDFSLECQLDTAVVNKDAFRHIDDLSKGNFYIARGHLLFAFDNTYEATTLQYSIRCLTKPEEEVTKLPKVRVVRGRNQVVIELLDNKSFKDGYYYIMDVKLPDGEEKQLRFIYKDAE